MDLIPGHISGVRARRHKGGQTVNNLRQSSVAIYDTCKNANIFNPKTTRAFSSFVVAFLVQRRADYFRVQRNPLCLAKPFKHKCAYLSKLSRALPPSCPAGYAIKLYRGSLRAGHSFVQTVDIQGKAVICGRGCRVYVGFTNVLQKRSVRTHLPLLGDENTVKTGLLGLNYNRSVVAEEAQWLTRGPHWLIPRGVLF